MGFFQKLKASLQKTQNKISHELKRIFSGSKKLTANSIEELEAALLSTDLGRETTKKIVDSVRLVYETQGKEVPPILEIARGEVEKSLSGFDPSLKLNSTGLTIISLVGVNGTGKTTTAAKIAHFLKAQNKSVMMAACDTFRAAAIEQLKTWGQRLDIPVIAGAYGADPASVAHDAISSALAKQADVLLIDTAGRLHTKSNLMQELQKLYRVTEKKFPGAPHETLLVLDGSTGMNALNQAKVFHQAVSVSGLVITKLDGSSRGGMVVAIQKEFNIPVKFIGVGEQLEDLQPFNASEFASAMFSE